MTETYKMNEIVKKIDTYVLEALFQKLGVSMPNEGWKAFTCRNPQPLYAAIAALPAESRNALGEALVGIAPVADEKSNIQVIRTLLRKDNIELPENVDSFNVATLAAWCYATRSEAFWRELVKRTEVNAKKRSEWTCFDLKFKEEPARGLIAKRVAALEKTVTTFIQHTEFRGYSCKSENYSDGDTETIVFYLPNHKTAIEYWEDNAKAPTTINGAPVFNVVLRFDYDMSRLGLVYDSTTQNCDSLAHELAAALFGADSYTQMETVKYDLQKWKDKWVLDVPQNLGYDLRRAVITGLELRLNAKSRRTYIEKDDNLQEAIRSEIGKERLLSPNTTVTRVHLRLTYDTPRRKNMPRTFKISETSIAGYNAAPRSVQKMLTAFLNAHNIIRNANDNTSH